MPCVKEPLSAWMDPHYDLIRNDCRTNRLLQSASSYALPTPYLWDFDLSRKLSQHITSWPNATYMRHSWSSLVKTLRVWSISPYSSSSSSSFFLGGGAVPVAYGGFQPGGLIRAAATCLCQSRSKAGFSQHLQTESQLTATMIR